MWCVGRVRVIATVLKTVVGKLTEGSNPSRIANGSFMLFSPVTYKFC